MKSNIVLLLASTLITLLLAEFITNYWLVNMATPRQLSRYGTYEQVEANRPLRFTRHHYLQFIPKPNYKKGHNKHNTLGYRGDDVEVPKPKNVFRIVALGGSTTYTSAVSNYKQSYPYLLQAMLRERGYPSVEVVNAGVIAYSTWESLMNLQFRVLDLEPDLIIIYHGVNDLAARFVYPYSAYQGDNSGSRVPYTPPKETFWDNSALLRILRTQLGLRRGLGGLGFVRTFEYVPTNLNQEWLQQATEGNYPSGIFREQSVDKILATNPPVFFERNLRSMIAIANEHKVKTVLATFALSPEFTDMPRASSTEYTRAIASQNDLVLDICREHGLACYDFAKEMPPDKALWDDGMHVNVAGARIKAALFADFLVGSGLLPQPADE